MIDELIAWGLKPPPILGDGAYGDTTELRTGLEERELEYVLDVKGTTSAYSEDVKPVQPPKPEGRGRPPAARYHEDPSSLKELALAAGKKAAQTVTWREGTRGKMNPCLSTAAPTRSSQGPDTPMPRQGGDHGDRGCRARAGNPTGTLTLGELGTYNGSASWPALPGSCSPSLGPRTAAAAPATPRAKRSSSPGFAVSRKAPSGATSWRRSTRVNTARPRDKLRRCIDSC